MELSLQLATWHLIVGGIVAYLLLGLPALALMARSSLFLDLCGDDDADTAFACLLFYAFWPLLGGIVLAINVFLVIGVVLAILVGCGKKR